MLLGMFILLFFPMPSPLYTVPTHERPPDFFLGCQSLGGHSIPTGSECLESPKEPAVKQVSSQVHLRLISHSSEDANLKPQEVFTIYFKDVLQASSFV